MPHVIKLQLGTPFWSERNKSFRKLILEHKTIKSQWNRCGEGRESVKFPTRRLLKILDKIVPNIKKH